MRKLFFLFVAFVATTCLWAYDFQSGDLYYNITSDTTVEVTYQQSWSSSNYSGLTSVTIPETVTYNGTTYNVTSIGEEAFEMCTSLTSVTIPNSVTSIGEQAFAFCSSLISITIPESVISIGKNAFAGCSSLSSITIPNSVTSIGLWAFSNCSALTSVTIGNRVTSIGDGAFRSCHSLTSITIGNSVTSIGDCAFTGCSSLTSVTIPNSVTSIGEQAFAYCYSLISITIPNSVTNIGESAFGFCFSLMSVVVESDNTIYDSRDNCNAIIETATNTLIAGCQNTTIPNSVTSIGDYAAWGCRFLTSVTIPDSVTSIGNTAFSSCYTLTTITIPNSVTSIGESAFSYCESLRIVICEAVEVPELGSYVFSKTPITKATLYVPAQSLNDYKAADQWKDFGTILPLEEAPSAVENTRLPIANGAKLLRDGQLLILKDDKTYTIMGAEIQ